MIKQDKETHQSQASDAGSLPPYVTAVVRSRDKSNPTKTKEPEGSMNIKKNWDLTPIT
jgi:hypothetical protein